jgi:hypothetical protein
MSTGRRWLQGWKSGTAAGRRSIKILLGRCDSGPERRGRMSSQIMETQVLPLSHSEWTNMTRTTESQEIGTETGKVVTVVQGKGT